MFYDISRFPELEELQSNWRTVLAEYTQLKTGVIPYFEEDLYLGEWDIFPFVMFGEFDPDRCKLCPKTWELLKRVPELRTAGFSILRHTTDIHPHTGGTHGKVLRCHLGLITPSNGALIVEDEPRRWEEGKFLIFDDNKEHYAYNHNVSEDRVVLLIDIPKP
jgi:beta-hydroxylase